MRRAYYPEQRTERYDLGYLGTYSADRQPALDRLLLEPARRWTAGRFVVAGSQYPATRLVPRTSTPRARAPPEHRSFYNAQRVHAEHHARRHAAKQATRRASGCSRPAPVARPIISDRLAGSGGLLRAERELFIAESSADVLRLLRHTSDDERRAVGESGRRGCSPEHTAAHRAEALEGYLREIWSPRSLGKRRPATPLTANVRGLS